MHPRWAGDPGAKMASFVLSAHVKDANTIHVRWNDTSPFQYERFNVRWDRDDHEAAIEEQHKPVGGVIGIGAKDPQQIEVTGAKTRGETDIGAKDGGTYIISIQGCDSGGLFGLGSECKQGWSFPVEVDHNLVTLPKPAPTLPLPPPDLTKPLADVLDGPMLETAQVKEILKAVCRDPEDMLDTDGDHVGELKTDKALAVLRVIRDSPVWFLGPPAVDCIKVIDEKTVKVFTREELLTLVNAKIKAAKVVSQPGTNDDTLKSVVGGILGLPPGGIVGGIIGLMLGGPGGSALGAALGAVFGAAAGALLGPAAFDPGDYDMRLVGLLHIVYRFGDLLDDSVRKHLVDTLLTVRGGADQRREHVWVGGIPTPIPESENHILMTESSRYLTNQLLAVQLKQANKSVPVEYDNDQNGMTDWMLKHLQSFVQNDFFEYNARPYTYQAMQGISNLYEFAGPTLLSNPCWRSNPPDPAQKPIPRGCHVRRGARIVMDYLAARYATASLGLRRASPNRRQADQRHYSRLFGRQSDSMTWRYLTLSRENDIYRNHRYGRLPAGPGDLITPVLGAYRLPRMIAELMSPPASSYFQRFSFDRDDHPGVEIYYGHPRYLISAGGIHDQGRAWLIEPWFKQEDAWARPTTLMPLAAGVDYNHFVRLDGSRDDGDRVNTCVAPGFACGLNPVVPSGIPEACLLKNGNWTFIDFNATSPGCDMFYGFYVVVYKQPCVPADCQKQAGDGGSFGFFEVTFSHNLEQLANDVLTLNQGTTFVGGNKVNVYKAPGGRTYHFRPMTSGSQVWGVEAVEDGATVTTFEREIWKWPLADGEIMRSRGHEGCVVIDNPLMQQRLILDYTDANDPKRTRVWLPNDCTCPLNPVCLPPRYE